MDDASTVERYDLAADPLMLTDLAGDEPARAAKLAAQAAQAFAPTVTEDVQAPEGQTWARLFELGYLEPPD